MQNVLNIDTNFLRNGFSAFIFLLLASFVTSVSASDGVITIASKYGAKETMDRFENVLSNKGMKVFARINHSEGADSVGIELRATELIIFGNPKVGSPLMRCAQLIALDLPQKALVWADEAGKVWLSYNDPEYLKTRHSVAGCDAVFDKVSKALAGLTNAAVSQ